MLPGDSAELRKQRGAFFTPYSIAEFLASWALRGEGSERTVLDPTCGEGVFLLAAANQEPRDTAGRWHARCIGVDIHASSLDETQRLLATEGHGPAELHLGDFFDERSPDQLDARIPYVDAVVGNPPFVRYQEHRGDVRRKAAAAALAQGVRLSGLASSWAALLVHSSSFLKPDGRIAMVVPAELLSVGYAEPIRQWLRRRFKSVHLVLFEKLQFADAEEQVVLLVARGTGGCNAFTLHEVRDASELAGLHIFDADAYTPRDTGKWTELLVPEEVRGILRHSLTEHFTTLSHFGTVELGTVTGANKFFTLSETTRQEFGLQPGKHVQKTVPPGSRHIPGLQFTLGQWEQLRLQGERVWMLNPEQTKLAGGGLQRYVDLGEQLRVHEGYKCSNRSPWWRPPVQPAPDMFFTYMSHVMPRLISNDAAVTFVNSMHGVTLNNEVTDVERAALPFLALNTVTMLSAELTGRTYGGGILKMEPREAAQLALPGSADIQRAWIELAGRRQHLDELTRAKRWTRIAEEVDTALLTNTLGIAESDLQKLRAALLRRRARRQRREEDGTPSR